MAAATFTPTSAELALTNQLFLLNDKQKLGIITGDAAIKAFGGANLPNPTLGQIWAIADADNNGFLICWDTSLAVWQNYLGPLTTNVNTQDIKTNKTDPSTTSYLNSVASKIGATSTYTEDNIYVSYNFYEGGDWARNNRPVLEGLINKNVQVTFWTGDAVRVFFDIC